MGIIKKIVILIIVLIVTYFLAGKIGEFYTDFFGLSTGFSSFIVPDFLHNFFNGVLPTYIFFLTLFFTAFGGEKKYWWIGILLIPAAAFELYFDLAHIYFPIILGFAGWILGFLISKFLPKINNSNASI